MTVIRKQSIVGVFVLAGLVAVAYYGGKRWAASSKEICQFCQRHIHQNMRVIATSGSKRIEACCLRCILTGEQQGATVTKVASVTDYGSAQTLAPERAYYVEGSDAAPCAAAPVRREEQQEPLMMAFDRCLPSVVAFRDRDEAERFSRRHGGRVLRLQDLTTEISRQQAPTESRTGGPAARP